MEPSLSFAIQLAISMPSFIAMFPPSLEVVRHNWLRLVSYPRESYPRNGTMGCIESPSSVTLPFGNSIGGMSRILIGGRCMPSIFVARKGSAKSGCTPSRWSMTNWCSSDCEACTVQKSSSAAFSSTLSYRSERNLRECQRSQYIKLTIQTSSSTSHFCHREQRSSSRQTFDAVKRIQ